MLKSIEKILVDIIKHELNLPDVYGTTSSGDAIPTVFVYSQNIKLFNTDKLQICIRTVSARPFSNRQEFITNPDGSYSQVQYLNIQRLMQVDCYSRNNEARERFWEVTAALNSIYAQQQMDLYNFKIGIIPEAINNISGIDGGSDINRFTTTFNVLTHEQKTTSIDYYDKFYLTAETEGGQFANISST